MRYNDAAKNSFSNPLNIKCVSIKYFKYLNILTFTINCAIQNAFNC